MICWKNRQLKKTLFLENQHSTIDYRNPHVISKMEIEALTKELGPEEMVYFIQQFDRGEGEYTTERENLLTGISMEEALHELKALRRG